MVAHLPMVNMYVYVYIPVGAASVECVHNLAAALVRLPSGSCLRYTSINRCSGSLTVVCCASFLSIAPTGVPCQPFLVLFADAKLYKYVLHCSTINVMF